MCGFWGFASSQSKSLSTYFGGEQRPAVQVTLQSPFPLLWLDHLSHRKASVQEQTFHPSWSLLCRRLAFAKNTFPSSREGPTGLLQEHSWPVAWEVMGYLTGSHLQLFITDKLFNYLDWFFFLYWMYASGKTYLESCYMGWSTAP